MKSDDLDLRSQRILRQAVHTFIASGEPVGSRTLAKLNPEGLSPATIRNIMSDLEETGYVYQPHTSAGRMPTDKGYRFYVSTLVQRGHISQSDRERIGSSFRETAPDVGALAKKTSRLLSDLTDNVSFVVGPDIERDLLRHVDLVKLSPHKILVVLVSQTGQIVNRVIEVTEELTGEELQKCARYLVDEFSDYNLLEMREALASRMRQMQAIYDRLVGKALTLGTAAFTGSHIPQDVYLEGTSRMLGKPEFKSNIERARQLLSILEEKGRLLEILNACLDGHGVRIVIGSEARSPDFEGISLIAAHYRFNDQELGSLGIMGPTRMRYDRFISVVEYMAQSLSEALSRSGNESTN